MRKIVLLITFGLFLTATVANACDGDKVAAKGKKASAGCCAKKASAKKSAKGGCCGGTMTKAECEAKMGKDACADKMAKGGCSAEKAGAKHECCKGKTEATKS